MIMVSIALVMAVVVTNIYAKKDMPQRCPEWTVRLALRFFPAHYMPGMDTGPHYGRHNRTHALPAIIERRTVETTQPASARPDVSQLPPPHLAAMKVTGSNDEDRTGRLSCCGCRLRRKDASKLGASDGDRASTPSRASRGSHVPTTLETFDFRRSEAEWRIVAKFTDRVFFWLFLVMSLCVQSKPQSKPLCPGQPLPSNDSRDAPRYCLTSHT